MIFILIILPCWSQLFVRSCVQIESAVEQANVDMLKVAWRTKAKSIRQNLNGSTFTNFSHVHPALQVFILKRIQNFYTTKKEIQDDISLYHCMSVRTYLFLFSNHFWIKIHASSCRNYLHLFCLFFGTWGLLISSSPSKTFIRCYMAFILYLKSDTLKITKAWGSSLIWVFR